MKSKANNFQSNVIPEVDVMCSEVTARDFLDPAEQLGLE
jgi:hypothetical protein